MKDRLLSGSVLTRNVLSRNVLSGKVLRALILIVVSMSITSCATYYAMKNPAGCRDSGDSNGGEKCEADLDVDEAVKLDIELARGAIDAIKEQRRLDAYEAPARHSGKDSGLCEVGQKKVCSAKAGCVCENSDVDP